MARCSGPQNHELLDLIMLVKIYGFVKNFLGDWTRPFAALGRSVHRPGGQPRPGDDQKAAGARAADHDNICQKVLKYGSIYC